MKYKVTSKFFSEGETQEYKDRIVKELKQATLDSIQEHKHIKDIEVSIDGGLHTLYLILSDDISVKKAMEIARDLGWAERSGSLSIN